MRLIPVSLHLIACTIVLQGTISLGEAGTPPARYLIIHADDAGMSHSANRGTIDAMEQGIVSSASIMVPCPWFVEIAEYARAHPERDFGIHLTLNCEWKRYRWGPVASRDKVPSLVDRDGYLWSNVRQVAEHAKTDEVEIELRAQIDRAKEFSVPITHLDTHMGSILARPDLIGIYVKLAIEYDVPILFLRTIDEEISKEYPALAEQGRKLQSVLEAHQLPMLDQMAQLYGEQPGRTRPQAYLETLRDLSPGVSQLIIHCGYDDAELRAITGSAAQRDEDRRVFSDPEVITFIKEQNIQVITWKQFREMQKSK
ncbi:MAG: polysaccharide deacetylase family protein [Pirellulaceae bacterium]